jgi:LuxR family maltose regulon positive regulatory protein
MPSKSTNATPKIRPPRTANVVLRERLFGRLDQSQALRCAWISGPPGAGKTTLAASYLQSRRCSSVWLQIDAGDYDPATFLHYLTLAAGVLKPRRKMPVPVFGQEYVSELAAFSRRFFRGVFANLPNGTRVVLDNFQDAAGEAFETLILGAMEEAGDGVGLIVVSRTRPGIKFTRYIANQQLHEILGDDLRFTVEETRQFLSEDVDVLPAASGLQRRSEGWAAGLVLMREAKRRERPNDPHAGELHSREALFNYFAEEAFDHTEPMVQDFLMRTSYMPRFTAAMAEQISGNGDANKLLDGLFRKQIFTERREGAAHSYQYHALFREFLHTQASQRLGAAEQRRLGLKAVELLRLANQVDDAIEVALAYGHGDAARPAIDACAEAMFREGRAQQLMSWIAALPEAASIDRPWLSYWLGLARQQLDETASREAFETAYQRFAKLGDRAGQLICASTFVQALFSDWGNFRGLRKWAERIRSGFQTAVAFAGPLDELRASAGYLCVAIADGTNDESVLAKAARVRALLESLRGEIDGNQWLVSAETLMRYLVYVGPRADIESLLVLAEPVAKSSRVSLLVRGRWWRYAGKACYYYTSQQAADKYWSAAKAIAERESFSQLLLELLIYEARSALLNHDLACAQRVILDIEARLDPRWPVWTALYHHVRCWLLLLQKAPHEALVEINRCLALHLEVETPESEIAFFRSWMGFALVELGRIDEAIALRRSIFNDKSIHGQDKLACSIALCRAYGALLAGSAEAGPHLAEGLRLVRERNISTAFWYGLPYEYRLCIEALRLGIETDYVRQRVRGWRLPPPDPEIKNWPWPVTIYTFGRFGILRDESPVRFEGKAQRKPIEFLKVLIAFGGRDVAAEELIDTIWPDPLAGGQKAIEITVHRLRKLLGQDDAVLVTDRRVTLNPRIVWVDLWALERRLALVVPAVHAALPARGALEAAAPDILDLYRGHFLAGERDERWLLPVRNRLAGRFRRFVQCLGEHLETEQCWPRATELYQRAIELDPLGEAVCRRLMVCLAKQGQRTEAIEVFRRWRQHLSISLGIKPTTETDALYRELLAS